NATQLPVDSYHPDLEWGPSAQDIRHRLQANLFLPPVRGFRLAVNGLVYQSGAPYNITTGVDDNHDLVINDRPLDATGRMIGRNSARGAVGRHDHAADPRVRVRRPHAAGATAGRRARRRRLSAGDRPLQSRILRPGRQRPQPRQLHLVRRDDDVAPVRPADGRVAGAPRAARFPVSLLAIYELPDLRIDELDFEICQFVDS